MVNNRINKIYVISLAIAFILSAITITFSYFSSQANGTDKGVNAKTAKLGLTLDVRRVTNEKTVGLFPLADSELRNALAGTTYGSCVDSMNKGRCQVYEIKLKNTGNITATTTGSLSLNAALKSKFTNLKWQEIRSATDITAVGSVHTMNNTSWKSNYVMGANTTATFYVIVWISDTGDSQNNTDRGSFNGVINFSSTAGVSANATISG